MNSEPWRIILTGFMGAGKTTVAESLSNYLDCRMIDLDALIAGREGRSISSIIDDDGESGFREIETRALVDALAFKNARVIALGGGTGTLEKNRALMEAAEFFTVWLDAPFDLCWQRIIDEGNLRPLARDKVQTQRLFELRRSTYALAMLRVEIGEESNIEEITARIIEALPEK